MQNENSGGRQMVSGNWTCSSCGTKISQLPFSPRDGQDVMCLDCYKKNSPRRSSGGGGGGQQRQMYKGNWKCAGCGKEITQLPFQPSGDRPLYCKDCFSTKSS